MPTRKKKSRKQRGSRYCGWGQVGQHRKSGMRGGVGKAGGRKHKWLHTIKYDPDRYTHKGFTTPSSLNYVKTINVGEIDRREKAKAFGQLGVRAALVVSEVSATGS